MVIGVGKAIMNNLPFMHIALAEPPAIACISGGILNPKKLVSHASPLEKAHNSLHLCADTRNSGTKVLVVDEQEGSL
ncbi:unnamed protein product [Penicillium glandicola]